MVAASSLSARCESRQLLNPAKRHARSFPSDVVHRRYTQKLTRTKWNSHTLSYLFVMARFVRFSALGSAVFVKVQLERSHLHCGMVHCISCNTRKFQQSLTHSHGKSTTCVTKCFGVPIICCEVGVLLLSTTTVDPFSRCALKLG